MQHGGERHLLRVQRGAARGRAGGGAFQWIGGAYDTNTSNLKRPRFFSVDVEKNGGLTAAVRVRLSLDAPVGFRVTGRQDGSCGWTKNPRGLDMHKGRLGVWGGVRVQRYPPPRLTVDAQIQ